MLDRTKLQAFPVGIGTEILPHGDDSVNRFRQVVLILSAIGGSWLGMQAVHELGHILAARMTGGAVARVVLHPLTISRTDVEVNPHPLAVVWAGPICGTTVPLLLWIGAVWLRRPVAFLLRFFAGFCLIANGLYLGVGSFGQIGDCGDLLRNGAAMWQLWLFGAITVPGGLALWHRQGPYFGRGSDARPVEARIAYGALAIFAVLLLLGIIVDGR